MSDALKIGVPQALLQQAFLCLCDGAERCEYKGMTSTFRCLSEMAILLSDDLTGRSPLSVAWDRCCDAMRPEERYGIC